MDALAWLAGAATALLHLAGALKSIPLIGALPIDFTVLSAALALPLYVRDKVAQTTAERAADRVAAALAERA